MATREENLKKINDELEKLSDEQLEQVTGGSTRQTDKDRRFFNILGIRCITSDNAEGAFGRYGVDFRPHVSADNEYIFEGANGYAHHPRIAALGYVLNKMKYNGYSGEWWNLDYTKNFLRDHFGSDVL